MHSKLVKTTLVLIGLIAAGTASADQGLSAAPQYRTDLTLQQNDRYPGQRSDRRIGRQSEPTFGNPYLAPYFAGGFGSGGDVVGRFTDNFGDTDRIRSGGGGFVEGGLLAAFDSATTLRLTVGYESDQTSRFNGIASFDRTRFDLTLLRNFGGFEVGAGLTAHVGVNFECDINSICGVDQDFDDALGYTVEAAFTTWNRRGLFGSKSRNRSRNRPLRTARLGLRFTGIEYDTESLANTTNNETVDGNSLALFIGLAL